ncbi:unnamed protein product [Rangifer tarandus platyrhynchus]|uniref:Uncharacterized protein n=2 Tax=Rangifer tarandus platyrhynchus TaxID=3082113 RepID=A0AC59YY89_RANTA|nr:unnamed protein product [Rangifer tarandus platyrhynchus]
MIYMHAVEHCSDKETGEDSCVMLRVNLYNMLREKKLLNSKHILMLLRMPACSAPSVVSNSLRPHGLCIPPGSSIHGILQARILKWVAISFSRGSSRPGMEPGSPVLQADSLPSEPPGKVICVYTYIYSHTHVPDFGLREFDLQGAVNF